MCKQTFCLFFAATPSKVDIAFLLGPYATKTQHQLQSNFIKQLLANVSFANKAVKFGILTYGKEATIKYKLGELPTQASLNNALLGLKRQGKGFDMASLVRVTMTEFFSVENGARKGVPKTIVLFTTEDIPDSTDFSPFKKDGIKLIVIGYGDKVDSMPLTSTVSQDGSVFVPKTEKELQDILDEVLKEAQKPGRDINLVVLLV